MDPPANQPSAHAKHVTCPHCRQGTMRPVTIFPQTEHRLRRELLDFDAPQEGEAQCQPIGMPFFSTASNVAPHSRHRSLGSRPLFAVTALEMLVIVSLLFKLLHSSSVFDLSVGSLGSALKGSK